MKLIVTIGRDGLMENRSLVSNHSAALFTSQRARVEIFRQIDQLGTICKRCSLICRSDEIVNGLCTEGVGCSVDVDILHFYQPESAEAYMIAQQVPHVIWRSFIESVTRQEWLSSLPVQNNEANDVKW